MRRLVLLLPALACVAATVSAPPAKVDPVTDTYHGEKITDPYRWMEKTGPDFVAWARAQDAQTRGELTRLPGYAKLSRDTAAAVEAEIRVGHAQRVGELIYYKKLGHGEAQASLYVRPLAGGAEKRLVDPVALGGATTTITEYAVSADNSRLSYALSSGGSEESVLHFVDLRTGHTFPEAIDRARFAGASWADDGKTVYFTRLKPGGVGADRFSDVTVYRHHPGTDPAKDEAVLTAVSIGSALGRQGFVSVVTQPGCAYAFAGANSGVSPESEWYVTSAASLAGPGVPHWTRIATLADKIDMSPVAHGSTAYLSTFRDAPRRKIISIDLSHPDMTHAAVVLPEQTGVVKNIAMATDGVYVAYADAAFYRLRRVGFAGGPAVEVPTPYQGVIYELASDPRAPGVVASLESWVQPSAYYLASGTSMRALDLAPPFPMDISSLVTETIQARAGDGTMIPVSVVHKRGLKMDGSAPTLVDAYGAYGISSDPYFNAPFIPFLLRGGVYAEAHVRGGGEFGEDWHLAGKGANKPNTWRDFIAAVGALEKAGYTSAGRVAGMGVSAGGVMIGRTITERPDLLAAAVMWAPMINTLRFETTEGGPANVAEFGTVSTAEGYAALRAMDSYSHVKPGTKYPAVLITGGMNDHRVPVWMAGEMAARLQAASTSGKPVRLRVDFAGGHHLMGVSKADLVSQSVDTEAFVLHAEGVAGFK